MFENVFNAMTGRQKVKYDQIFICGMIDNKGLVIINARDWGGRDLNGA